MRRKLPGGASPGQVTLVLGVIGALALILALHVAATWTQLGRRPNFDETQFVHEAWLLAHGKRIYRDFFDSHAPLFVAALRALDPTYARPGGRAFDLRALFEHTRLPLAVFGTLAVGCATLVAHRISRRPSALVVVPAVLLASHWTWLRGVEEVRVEPIALTFFWGGTLLLLGKRDDGRAAVRVGLGLALLVLVVATCPKWPLELAVLAVFALLRLRAIALRDPRNLVGALAPPLATLGLALFLTLRLCSFGDYAFFVFRFNGAVVDAFRHSTTMIPLFEGERFHFCPRAFRPGWALLGGGIAVLALVSPRARRDWIDRDGDRLALALVLALVVAAAIEIGLVYPFPYLWAQYYLLWSFALAIVYGCLPAAVVALARGVGGVAIELGAVIAALAIHLLAVRERFGPLPPDYYWGATAYLLGSLREGDTVWLESEKHPIAALDASYFWEGFPDRSHGAVAYAMEHPGGRIPAADEATWPICRLEQGLEPRLRFVAGGPDLQTMPVQTQCFQRLYLAGALRRTPMPGAFEVVRNPSRDR